MLFETCDSGQCDKNSEVAGKIPGHISIHEMGLYLLFTFLSGYVLIGGGLSQILSFKEATNAKDK